MTDVDLHDQAAVNAVLLDRTERIEKELFGNGRPGVLVGVATLRSEVDDIQKRIPSNREKRAGWAAIIVAIITAAGSVLAAYSSRVAAAIQ